MEKRTNTRPAYRPPQLTVVAFKAERGFEGSGNGIANAFDKFYQSSSGFDYTYHAGERMENGGNLF